MTRKTIPPVETTESLGNRESKRNTHPAFGTIVLTQTHGGGDVMFGSDVPQMSRIRIEIKQADLKRSLSNDWIYGNKSLLCFEMTNAQFAEFITSSARGEGTPCTLRYTNREELPGIEQIETKQEIFKREIKESAKHQTDDIQNVINKLEEIVDSGKLSKKELKALLFSLQNKVSNLPSNMKFVVDQAEEALEKATTAAKIEVESFISAKAKSLGLQRLDQLLQIGNDQKDIDKP